MVPPAAPVSDGLHLPPFPRRRGRAAGPARLGVSVLALALSLGFAGCGGDGENRAERPDLAPPVEAVRASFGALPLVARVSGTVRAENQVQLFAETSGRITEVYVQNGDEVMAGQPLVQLLDRQQREQVRQAQAGAQIAEARVRQARARRTEAEAQARRTATLGELVSELERETQGVQVETATADLALAQAQLEQALATLAEQEEQLRQTTVRAPMAGTVGERHAEVGLQVSPSTPLFVIGRIDRVQVRVEISDTLLPSIRPGQAVRVHAPAPNGGAQVLDATLTRISPFLNAVTRSAEAQIEVVNPDRVLHPGMFVPVDLLYGRSEAATLLPLSALYTDPNTGREGVFVLERAPEGAPSPSTADEPPPFTEPLPVAFRSVQVLARGPDQLAVSGVGQEEWVVTLGQDLLSTARAEARVRPTTWDQVMALQARPREALLQEVLQPARPTAHHR